MKFSSISLTAMLMGSQLPHSVFAQNNINVVTSTASTGKARHLATGNMKCRLWEQDMLYQDLTGHHQWFCSFDDNGIKELFGGFEDKIIVGMSGFDMKEFLEMNNAVSGKTVLVMRGAEVFHDTIAIRREEIIDLEQSKPPREKGEAPIAGGFSAADADARAPRLKFPKPAVGAEAPILDLRVPIEQIDSLETPIVISRNPRPVVGAEGNLRGNGPANSVEAPANDMYTRAPKAQIAAQAPGYNRRLAPTTGVLKTLVVRVNAEDNNPPAAADL